jgi:hypothetical protein
MKTRKLVKAIHELHGGLPHLAEECFLEGDRMSQFGDPPYRIDIPVEVPGLVFEEVHPNCIRGRIGGKEAPIINLQGLIKSKPPGAIRTPATSKHWRKSKPQESGRPNNTESFFTIP